MSKGKHKDAATDDSLRRQIAAKLATAGRISDPKRRQAAIDKIKQLAERLNK